MTHHNLTALVGGNVWTAGYAAPRTLDILIQGDTILRVAERGELGIEASPDTAGHAPTVLDYTGKLILPGFQDAHVHASTGGLDLLTCDLSACSSSDEVAQAVRYYADTHPDLPWVVGGGWTRELWGDPNGPTREELDTVVPDRPAVLSPYDRHGLWLNSAALAAAGIDAETRDPDAGFIRRAPDSLPSGMVEESAMELVRRVMPEVKDADLRQAILAAQDYLLSVGVTSIQDALVGTGLGMHDQHGPYCQLLTEGLLDLRLTTALWWDPARGIEQIEDLLERRRVLEAAAGPDRVVADTVKMMVDGTGVLFLGEQQIREATVALDGQGFSIHYHSYGDATTNWVLDAIEAARDANGFQDRHHHIAHLFVVSDADLPRFAELGVSANLQGFWSGSAVPHEHLGCSTAIPDPQGHEYPFGQLLAAGAPLAAGSDWPVTTPDPLEAIRVAAGIHSDHGETHFVHERNRLDIATMLTAYTAGSAHVNGRGSKTGRIAPGYLADFAVIDRSSILDANSLRDARVVETWIGGRLVFTRPNR